MSRVFVGPQAGRAARTGSVPADEEPWGTTSSKSQFRAYEPAEARSCRSTTANLRPNLEVLSALPFGASPGSSFQRGPGRPALSNLSRIDDEASAVTDLTTSSASKFRGQESSRLPKYVQAERQRVLPDKPFHATSTYQEDQALAQQARHGYFPYRDEFAPRSKRLLYEMALARCSRDSVKSASSCAGSESCFTVASKAKSGVSGAGRLTSSAPNFLAVPSPPMTADSQRIPGGVGALAKRRKDAQLRAPTQWAPDAEWLAEKLETDGPAGLHTHNAPAKRHAGNLTQYGESMLRVEHMMPWNPEP